MKKLLTLMLTTVLAWGCVGCGGNDSAMVTDEPAVEINEDGGIYIGDGMVPLAPGDGEDESPVHKYVLEVVDLVNEERAKEGIAPVELDLALCEAAQVRAEEAKKSFSHTRPDGRRCFTALSEKDITYRIAGENLGGHIQTPKRAVAAWMKSEGHRKNIMNPKFSYIGIGYVSSGNYWAQFFVG